MLFGNRSDEDIEEVRWALGLVQVMAKRNSLEGMDVRQGIRAIVGRLQVNELIFKIHTNDGVQMTHFVYVNVLIHMLLLVTIV